MSEAIKKPTDLTLQEITQYTDRFKIPFLERMHFHSSGGEGEPLVWPTIDENTFNTIKLQHLTKICHYPEAIPSLQSFDFAGKRILILGSSKPWAELLVLKRGAEQVLTVEYREINWPFSADAGKKWGSLVYKDLGGFKERNFFDVFLSYSSIEHSGLGRYGDPIDPDGDLECLKAIQPLMKPSATFLIAFPLGQDAVLFNRHRVYGRLRLKKILSVLDKTKMGCVPFPLREDEAKIVKSDSIEDILNAPIGTDGIQRLLIIS